MGQSNMIKTISRQIAIKCILVPGWLLTSKTSKELITESGTVTRAEIALPLSSTLPPPIATTASILHCLWFFTASSIKSGDGSSKIGTE